MPKHEFGFINAPRTVHGSSPPTIKFGEQNATHCEIYSVCTFTTRWQGSGSYELRLVYGYWRGTAKKRVSGALPVPMSPSPIFLKGVQCEFSSFFRHFWCPERTIQASPKVRRFVFWQCRASSIHFAVESGRALHRPRAHAMRCSRNQ